MKQATLITDPAAGSVTAKRLFVTAVLTLMIALSAVAQKTVTGTVTDELGEPLYGVSIVIKGTARGVTSDAKGQFSLKVDDESTVLVFRYLGMESQQASVRGRTRLEVKLRESSSTLSEVTVVSTGYQRLSRERSTAAFGFVDSTRLNNQNFRNLETALEGQVAGLRVNTVNDGTSQQPIIRGVGTLSADVGTQPLIVIDNMPTGMSLTDINPYIVESITVLKDAAAASIYGARAANGVIVVTTKSARNEGVHVSVNADWFLTSKQRFDALHLQSASQMIDFQTQLFDSYVADAGSVDAYFDNRGAAYYQPLYQLYRDRHDGKLTQAEVDAQLASWRKNDYYAQYRDHLWRTAVNQRYNVRLSQRAGKGNHSLTFSYSNSKEQDKADFGTNAFAVYLHSNYKLTKWLSVDAGIDVNLAQGRQGTSYGYNAQERYLQLIDAEGRSVTYPNASFGGYAGQGTNLNAIGAVAHPDLYMPFSFNAIDQLHESMTKTKSVSLRPFVSIDAQFLRFFRYTLSYQYEWNQNKTELFDEQNSYAMRMTHNGMITPEGKSLLPAGGRYRQTELGSNNYTLRNQLGFDRTWLHHAINAIVGMEFRQTHRPRIIEQLMYGYNPQTLTSANMDWAALHDTGWESELYGRNMTLGGPATRQQITRHRYASLYANAGYTFMQKYNLTGSIRWDEADLFGLDTNEQKHPLWSLGAGWLLSEEKFMKTVRWIDYLRLRATYGINGNVDQASTTYFVATYKTQRNPVTSTYLDYDDDDLPNPRLRWEKTATTNVGIDFRVFDNVLSGSLEYYNRRATDLLVKRYMDPTLGAENRVVNNGAMRNRGFELTLNANIYRNRDWKVAASLTYSRNSNRILEVDVNQNATAADFIRAPQNNFIKGSAFNTLWAYRLGRVENGYPVILDEEGNDMVTFDADGNVASIRYSSSLKGTAALKNCGTITPRYNGGLGLQVGWRDIELNAMFIFSGGNQLRMPTPSLSQGGDNTRESLTSWNGTSGVRLYHEMSVTARQYASTFDEWWQYCDAQVKSAAFMKLRNVSISYHLPSQLCRKAGLSGISLRLQASNLLSWSAAGDDIDPETFGLNGGSRSMKRPRTFSIGLSANF